MRRLRPWEIDPNWTCPPYVAPKESFAQKMRRYWEEGAWVRRDLGMGLVAVLIWPLVLLSESGADPAEEAAKAEERGHT